MDPRFFLLTLPSLVALSLLVAHSFRSLPRRRAVAFWVACTVYGVLRGLGVRRVVESGLDASMPYEIREPMFEILGVSLQEVAGWTIVTYLGWWLGGRFAAGLSSRDEIPLFPQVLWCLLWLGAISWAVESTAVAAGWWFWRLAVPEGLLGRVPFIGLVDWGFVAIDFLLPFLAFSRPGREPWRWATLLLFPIHFGGHLFTERLGLAVPVPAFHAVHWGLLALLLALALRSKVTDSAFTGDRRTDDRWALAALTWVLADLLAVQVLWLGRFDLLPALAPATVLALTAARPRWFAATGAAAAVLTLVRPGFALAAVPALVHALVRWGRGGARARGVVLVGATLVAALVVHHVGASRERALTSGLTRAIEARDRGDLEEALARLRALNRPRASSHAALVLEGEILYRVGRLDEARRAFRSATEIKGDLTAAHRHLAVIDLRQVDRQGALRAARRGLDASPADLELRYLHGRAAGQPAGSLWSEVIESGPGAVSALSALAFEVDDRAGARQLLDLALERWPGDATLRLARQRLRTASEGRRTP